MCNKKVSVIMPVYNASKYLRRSIECILNQTYKNIEFIIINDGSTDDSGNICEEYAKIDPRIVYSSQENHGQGYTRSRGVEMATGDFIAFIDDDDRCDHKMYEIMVKSAEKEHADLCVCQWNYELPNGTHTINNRIYDKSFYGTMNSVEFTHYLYKYESYESNYGYANGLVASPWNKLFRSHIIKGLQCSGFLGEDEEMNDWINSKNVRVAIIQDELYYWCQNLDSMSNKPFSDKRYHYLDMLLKRSVLFKKDKYLFTKTLLLYCNLFIEYYYKAEKQSIIHPPMRQYKEFKPKFITLLKSKHCSLKFSIRMMLFICSKSLYKKLVLREY